MRTKVVCEINGMPVVTKTRPISHQAQTVLTPKRKKFDFISHLRVVCPLLNLLSLLVEGQLLPRDQRLLQPLANLQSLVCVGNVQRHGLVIQTSSRKLVGLRHKGRLETTVVVSGYIPRDTTVVVVVDQVLLRVQVHRHFTLGTNDLGDILLTVGHHARRVKVGNLATPKLNDTHGVVAVVALAQLWVHCCDAVCGDALGDNVGAKEPQRQVNIVDVAVDKDTT